MASGSIFTYIGRSLWFIGDGPVLVNGANLTDLPSLTTSLRFKLYESGGYNGIVYEAGLTVPATPTAAAGSAGTKLNGTYSVRLTAVRSSTGAESNASITSATVSLSNQKMAVTFPAAVGNGHDKWGVYVTRTDFGSTG